MRAAIVLLLVIPAFVLLYGCASGVHMTDEDVRSCRDSGDCTVWTQAEIRALIRKAMAEGYGIGWRDANKQSGRGL